MYGNLTFNTMLQSTALFLWVKDSTFSSRIISWIINTISNYSYGIYLVHVLVINILFDNGIFWTMAYPLISLPLIVITTLVCSFGIIFVLRKIPLGKYISG
jgi:surface polysaccharide O-acyltransferase-like enzyme